MSTENRIEMRGIGKSFSGTRVLNDVNFSCISGEVHALVGLNGAGKSTLMKILGGVRTADEGSICFNDREVSIHSPASAGALGISMIHQEYSLINELSVAGNIFFGKELRYGNSIFLNKREMFRRVEKELEHFGVQIDARKPLRLLNSGEKQIVEIIRAIIFNSWLIVMDEPTSALSEKDKQQLFRFIEQMKMKGISIIYISHHMPEIFGIAERVTVMRDGRVILCEETKAISEDTVVQAMTGKELDNFVKPHKTAEGETLLSVEKLSKTDTYQDISFTLSAGEVTILTGLRGCGAAELAKAIFGLDSDYSGTISYRGKPPGAKYDPFLAVKLGMGFVTENRDKNGIFAALSVYDNIALPFLEKNAKFGLIDKNKVDPLVDSAISQTSTKVTGPAQEIRFLSGGNKQKVCFSRWRDESLRLLILLEPTRGIDVHAKADIYRIIETLAAKGVSILILSYEIDEVLMLADRILTMYGGQIVHKYQHPNFDRVQILADISTSSPAKKEIS
ncbi:sugar ABC transporter ATP-binding protein [Candidatus Haliotispira prima]|uniref:Sugar ABC transporter ATP-binding protein n=1 Tax=Candidatus Haliotispira prima TaxID=3034016 RepID=A0ABY8MJW1_9SPIO|nr:sugar ABC transporter ATP-binding protein [Candidatus Haliotispira prima]